jgi:prepilin-type processing-associated H-X9-DG protein/prepilin-type N-terminal cleavage/methylation domain-containing protein
MSTTHPPRHPYAFTLVELLVVISIIALLIGLLLPVLATSRRTAQSLTCATTARQIGVGHFTFQVDHRSYYPQAGGFIEWDDPTYISWMEQVDAYIDAKPTDDAEQEPFYSGCPLFPQDSPYHYFLSANAAYLEADRRFAAVRGDSILNTTAFVIGGDLNRNFQLQDADKDDFTQNCLGLPGMDPAAADTIGTGDYWEPQHEGALNVLFADGHVARFKEYDASKMTFAFADMKPWQQP